MTTKIIIDGTIQNSKDAIVIIEKDKIIDFSQNQDFLRPIEPESESKQVLGSLFNNKYDAETKTHGIDQKANLDSFQVRGLTALDVLERVNFLPSIANSVSMQTKYLSVSKNARGRDDHINIVQAKKENDINTAQGGMGNMVKSMIGLKPKQ